MSLKQKLSEAEMQRIKDAVKEAEEKISGEIVPVIVEQSGPYRTANYKACISFSVFAFIVIVILDRYIITDATHTLYYDPMFIMMVVVSAGLVGWFLPNLSYSVKRLFLSRQHMDERASQRAENIFLEEEVFNTKHRTGIMLFISFFEHEVIVMADKGISKVVEQKEWDQIVNLLVENIHKGQIVSGIEEGIKRCGEILLEKGFIKESDDTNELRDDLRLN
ncbi:TPM domain-containing protein [Chryseosolibacter indicus]|uniref:TPM domain-containing protein n=1 Tax=Chryseosolibacter indicus TaxID=2782351 RepID=A0ABS5VX63_9BACT|nr:TPM domain-containing protein [Chryseosolibacter indicus]MBT1705999.1 hypothetical protein [Chryseosolibacter indicus]